MSFSALLIYLPVGSGMWIASLSTPGLVVFLYKWSCCKYCTLLRGRPRWREGVLLWASSSSEARILIWRGSSSSSCSAMSPVSPRYEYSEPNESDDRRGACFSPLLDSNSDVECSSERRGGGIKVRRGMLAGLEELEEGIVPVVVG
jgi:hypothetical protein